VNNPFRQIIELSIFAFQFLDMKNLGYLLLAICCQSLSAQDLFPIEIKGKFGYINSIGEVTIPAVYDVAEKFSSGYAVVALERKPCVIDASNKRIIDTGLYRQIGSYAEGMFLTVGFKNEKAYIDTKNNTLLKLPTDIYEARNFSEGKAIISKQVEDKKLKFNKELITITYKFAFIDTKGKLLCDFIYDDCDDFEKGVARVVKGNKVGLIQADMKEILPIDCDEISDICDGQYFIVAKNNKFGAVSTKGEWIINPGFILLFPFSEGLAGFMDEKGLFGFVDVTGKIVIKAEYTEIKPFAEGKAAVNKEGKWGFINTQGAWVIRNVFDNATYFSEGRCAVQFKRLWGYIDTSGKVVVRNDFDAAAIYYKGLAPVIYRNIPVYINMNGDVLPQLGK
jgi:hypothetical protein